MARKEHELETLQAAMEQSEFWEQPATARKTISQANELKAWTVPYRELQQRFHDTRDLLQEIDPQADLPFYEELIAELALIDKQLEELELRKMLSGEMDPKNCYLSINAGAGGTESCDWVSMLARMYQRWATKKGWKVELIDSVDGDVAGYKSITFHFLGPFAYGYSKAEKGVHRLVRISPFDSNARRHTSFASVDVTPEIDDDVEIEIRPEHLKVDTFRSSGAGGQHVNTTDSAVRVTHLPTGIVIACQKERSQVQNKETCIKLLRAKLYEEEILRRKRQVEALSDTLGEKQEIAWGHQIRNYVFQPYTLVKDARTKVEEGNIQAVMDGEIDHFVEAYLKEFGTRDDTLRE